MLPVNRQRSVSGASPVPEAEGNTVKAVPAVGVGGMLGTLARYKLGGFILHHGGDTGFSLST